MPQEPILKVQQLKVHFSVKNNFIFWKKPLALKAVDDISFELHKGETLGIVGESGCGKSTLARALAGLISTNSGNIIWQKQNLTKANKRTWKVIRKNIQMIFQDPVASLNPRMTIGQCIAEPLLNFYPNLSRHDIRQQVRQIMNEVGLLPDVINRYPHEFSGGQCQRAGIARALICKPELVICDEPVSALDVSVQAQIITLLNELKQKMNISLVFISHDLSVVKHLSDKIMVMYSGKLMELAPVSTLYDNPQHPYTKALLSAIPVPDPQTEQEKTIQCLQGDLPSLVSLPSGCVFRTRCPLAKKVCAHQQPTVNFVNNHMVACLMVKPEHVQTSEKDSMTFSKQ